MIYKTGNFEKGTSIPFLIPCQGDKVQSNGKYLNKTNSLVHNIPETLRAKKRLNSVLIRILEEFGKAAFPFDINSGSLGP